MSRAFALIEADTPDCDRVVTVRGEIDVGNAPALREWISRASDGGRRSTVVDLRGVPFLAISALYVLCDEQHRMAAHQARLTIVCDSPRAVQLFTVCRLDDVLHVVSSRTRDARGAPWTREDDTRAVRLHAWLQRYAASA